MADERPNIILIITDQQRYDTIVLAVAHDEFIEMGAQAINAFGKPSHILFDIKNCLPREAVTARL